MRITEAGITLARFKKLNLQTTNKTIRGNFSSSNWVTYDWPLKRCT